MNLLISGIQLTDYQQSISLPFTGKEKDSESGYYYFGARYFMPNLSIWNSVDPMADKYPSLSPYNYCAWNPMKDGAHIDVENPNPKNRKGGIHYQEGKNKYYYNKEKGYFEGAPNRVNRRLQSDKKIQQAIRTGLKYLEQ